MKINNNTLQSITALILGALIFYLLFGFKIVDPTNIAWVMEGDAGQHFLGWHFFRGEPWSFPIGSIQRYHYPEGTTMTFMDAIPLLGIPLKFFNSILPEHFQYTGIWLLMSYMLQAYFASLLLRKFTKDSLITLLGTTFFVLSTIMLKRTGGHEALAGHWVLLASLYLYFGSYTNKIKVQWLLLIIATSLIHFYLLVMILLVWGAYVLSYILKNKWTDIVRPIVYILITLLVLIIVMWVVGYFTIVVSDGGTGGYGLYSMNLLSPINPIGLGGVYTTFFKHFNAYGRFQYEGYNYLGLGVLLLLIVSGLNIVTYFKKINKNKLIPLLLVSFVVILLSLSNKITFGDKLLFEYKNPFLINELGKLVRSSGRLFWIMYYIITLLSIVLVAKFFDARKAVIIIIVALLIQIVDFYPWYKRIDIKNKHKNLEMSNDDLWNKIGINIDHIVMIPLSKNLNSLMGLYAVKNNNTINVGYVARYDKKLRLEYEEELLSNYYQQKLDDKTLYILDSDHTFFYPDSSKFSYGILSGYNVIYPKKTNVTLEKYPLSSKEFVRYNNNISFKSEAIEFLGWSNPERLHRWSLGKSSSLVFYLDEQIRNDVSLIIDGWTLGKQRVLLYVNDSLASDKIINSKNDLTFNIHRTLLREGGNLMKFEFPEAKKPNKNESRILALALKTFKLVEIKPVSLGNSIAHNSKLVEYIGWSNPEKSHRWSLGKSSDINVLFRKKNSNDIKFTVYGWTLKDIEVNLYVNGNLVKQKSNLSFIINNSFLKDGKNIFHFDFPNARRPNDKEKRVLALALKHFSLTEVKDSK